MRVLFIASEAAPIIKVGGLGDVGGSLPPALAKEGVDVRVMLPLYAGIEENIEGLEKEARIRVPAGGKTYPVDIMKTTLGDSEVPVYLLRDPEFLSNSTHEAIYDGEDGKERFLFFSQAVVAAIAYFRKHGWDPDVLDLNDWHTGMIPFTLEQSHLAHPPKTLLTIHNIGYQGLMEPELMRRFGYYVEDFEVLHKRNKVGKRSVYISTLREGLKRADAVSTVSQKYAEEILTPEYGMGLEDILRSRGDALGILNGIDCDAWNPATDTGIASTYDRYSGKNPNRSALLKEIGFKDVSDNTMLVSFVGRVDPLQKGIDIMTRAITKLAGRPEDFRFILLGTGAKKWEEQLRALAKKYPKTVVYVDRFDKDLAHRIYAGADSILVPSRYEPCGLIQMIAMRYGTVPIVRNTGGLADTVAEGKTGFVFDEYADTALASAMERALGAFRAEGGDWARIAQNGMDQDFSWDRSAKEYLALYERMLIIESVPVETT